MRVSRVSLINLIVAFELSDLNLIRFTSETKEKSDRIFTNKQKTHIIINSLSLFIELKTPTDTDLLCSKKRTEQLETVDRKRKLFLFTVQINRVQYNTI